MNIYPTKSRHSSDLHKFAGLREHFAVRLFVIPLIWISGKPGEWRRLDDETETQPLGDCDQPRLKLVEDDTYDFVIPLGHAEERHLVATGQVTTTAPELWLQLARSVFREWQTNRQNHLLELENEQFARQTIDCLEELNFMKFATFEMGSADLTNGVFPLVKKILEALRKSINAHTVDLIVDFRHQWSELVDLDKSFTAFDSSIPWPDTDRLITKFSDVAESRTFIKNYCECDDQCREFDYLFNFVITPVKLDSEIVAWLVAVNRTHSDLSGIRTECDLFNDQEFGTVEATILEAAATIIATHMANVNSLREQELMLTSTVKSLIFALEAKDTYTCGHSERVALYAQLIARKIGLDELQIERIYMTGLLHDIGKIGVSEQTLNHPGKLSDEQFEIIKAHPHSGWAILQGIKQLEYVLPGVLFHHERIDGRGYPDNLVEQEIPLEARILAVADAYDAMTSDRPYRDGMSHEKAASILQEGRGTQWDAEMVAIFLDAELEISEIRSHTHKSVPLNRPRGSIHCSND